MKTVLFTGQGCDSILSLPCSKEGWADNFQIAPFNSGLTYFDQAKRWLESTKECPDVIVGHSAGAVIALWVAEMLRREGRKVPQVKLISPSPLQRQALPKSAMTALIGQPANLARVALGENFVPAFDQQWKLLYQKLERSSAEASFGGLSPWSGKAILSNLIGSPIKFCGDHVMIFASRGDLLITPDVITSVSERINAPVHWVGCNPHHNWFLGGDAEAVTQEVMDINIATN